MNLLISEVLQLLGTLPLYEHPTTLVMDLGEHWNE